MSFLTSPYSHFTLLLSSFSFLYPLFIIYSLSTQSTSPLTLISTHFPCLLRLPYPVLLSSFSPHFPPYLNLYLSIRYSTDSISTPLFLLFLSLISPSLISSFLISPSFHPHHINAKKQDPHPTCSLFMTFY